MFRAQRSHCPQMKTLKNHNSSSTKRIVKIFESLESAGFAKLRKLITQSSCKVFSLKISAMFSMKHTGLVSSTKVA